MFKSILLLVTLSQAWAAEYSPQAIERDYESAPEYKAIMAQLAPYGDFSDKNMPVKAEDVVKPKPMGRGEQMVEEAKARNRAILAQNAKDAKAAADTTAANPQDDMQKLRAENKKTLESWKKEVSDQQKIWKTQQAIFLGRLKVYKENTFDIPVKEEKIIEEKVTPNLVPEVHIVGAAFKMPIRDQKDRPTCAAFAGIRAMEIILAQNKIEKDLSEQYLYWASKPTCRTSPCTEKGSWITHGLRYSSSQPRVDVPLESSCAYQNLPEPANETQVPLSTKCHQGIAKVVSFEDVRSLVDVVKSIKKNIPVIISAKLSENYYINNGLVTLEASSKKTGKIDGHAQGHAFLAVGVIELPEKLKILEGAFCLVVANSWGLGWGTGGYSCLTENWLTKFRSQAPFVAITKVTAD